MIEIDQRRRSKHGSTSSVPSCSLIRRYKRYGTLHQTHMDGLKHFHALGADLAITYGHDKSKPYVEPLAKELKAPIFLPCDMQKPGQIEAVFESIHQTLGGDSILRSTQSPLHRKRICTAASPTVHATVFSSPWMSLVILSYAWRGWRSR